MEAKLGKGEAARSCLKNAFTPGPKKKPRMEDPQESFDPRAWADLDTEFTPEKMSGLKEEMADLPTLLNSILSLLKGYQNVRRYVPAQVRKGTDRLEEFEKLLDSFFVLIKNVEASLGKPGSVFRKVASQTKFYASVYYHRLPLACNLQSYVMNT